MKLKLNPNYFKILIALWVVLLLIAIYLLSGLLNSAVVDSNKSVVNKNETASNNFVDILTCFSKDQNLQQKCLDDFIANYMQNKDTKETLHDMEVARGQNVEMESMCHPIAHSIGRYTYKKLGNVGDAFMACDQTCHSGCYHGVMERLFYGDAEIVDTTKHLTYDDLETKVPGICDKDKFQNPSSAIIFQCLHGVGHAILYSLDYDLNEALRTCDLLKDSYQQSSCYGGVIMENVTAFDKTKRDIKPSDPLYPCDALSDKYKHDCYLMQTSLMYEYGMNDEQIAKECLKAAPYESTCFVSLGRDLSNFVRTNDIPRVVKACEEYSGDYTRSCVDGSIYALIDNTWDASFAYKFCDSLQKPDNIKNCYADANRYLRYSYEKSPDDIGKQCDMYSKNGELCKSNIN